MSGYGLWLVVLCCLSIAVAVAVFGGLSALGPLSSGTRQSGGAPARLESMVRRRPPALVPSRRPFGPRPARGPTADRRRFLGSVESVLEHLIASLKAGRSLGQALEEAADRADPPVSEALGDVVGRYRAGASLPSALSGLAERWPVPEVAYLAACLETHLRTGGDVTALLVNLNAVVRNRRQMIQDLCGRTSEARFSATLLALLPVLMMAYILWSKPGQLIPLWSSPVGRAAAGVATFLWLAGVWFVRGLVRSAAREVEGVAGHDPA